MSIKKKLRDFTLDVEFTVHDEILALLGASGSGKSMTLKCIAGIETPDLGKIILDDKIFFDSDKKINLPPQSRRAGFLFQNYALFPNMTVAQNISFAATGDKAAKLKQNIARFKLDGLENVYPHKLSGGQLQRVAFARVLASHAEFLLLDEPFSALDSFLKAQLELELADVFSSYPVAVLVSHDQGEVFRLADKVAIIYNGKILSIDSKHETFNRPKNLAAAILTGYKNVSRAVKVAENKFRAVDWNLELTADLPDQFNFVAIHPKDLIIKNAPDVNTFRLPVVRVFEDFSNFIVILKPNIQCFVEKIFVVSNQFVYLQFPTDKIIFLRD